MITTEDTLESFAISASELWARRAQLQTQPVRRQRLIALEQQLAAALYALSFGRNAPQAQCAGTQAYVALQNLDKNQQVLTELAASDPTELVNAITLAFPKLASEPLTAWLAEQDADAIITPLIDQVCWPHAQLLQLFEQAQLEANAPLRLTSHITSMPEHHRYIHQHHELSSEQLARITPATLPYYCFHGDEQVRQAMFALLAEHPAEQVAACDVMLFKPEYLPQWIEGFEHPRVATSLYTNWLIMTQHALPQTPRMQGDQKASQDTMPNAQAAQLHIKTLSKQNYDVAAWRKAALKAYLNEYHHPTLSVAWNLFASPDNYLGNANVIWQQQWLAHASK